MKLTTKFLIAAFLGLFFMSVNVQAQETIPDSLGRLIPVNGQFFITIHHNSSTGNIDMDKTLENDPYWPI